MITLRELYESVYNSKRFGEAQYGAIIENDSSHYFKSLVFWIYDNKYEYPFTYIDEHPPDTLEGTTIIMVGTHYFRFRYRNNEWEEWDGIK